jgi:hypothetical protein
MGRLTEDKYNVSEYQKFYYEIEDMLQLIFKLHNTSRNCIYTCYISE